MARWIPGAVAASLLAALLVVPVAGATAWLQEGFDGGRTGATTDPGPATLDVAFSVQLQGWSTYGPPILIFDNAVFVFTRADIGGNRPELNRTALWRVDLDTAEPRLLADLSWAGRAVGGLASDGERIFVAAADQVLALSPSDGSRMWEQPYRAGTLATNPASGGPGVPCGPAAVADGTIYLQCDKVAGMNSAPSVVALDAATGEERWTWSPPPVRVEPLASMGMGPHATDNLGSRYQVLVAGEHVYAVMEEVRLPRVSSCVGGIAVPPNAGTVLANALYALDRANGELEWVWMETGASDEAVGDFAVAATPEAVYLVGRELYALDPAAGCPLWSVPLEGRTMGARLQVSDLLRSAMVVVTPDAIFAQSYGRTYRIEPEAPTPAWSRDSLLPQALPSALIVAGGRIYMLAAGQESPVRDVYMVTLSTEDGSPSDQHLLAGNPQNFAIGDGIAAAWGAGDHLFVLGRTAASIQLEIAPPPPFSPPGEEVALDLSATRPGKLSEESEFRVDWGGGSIDDWRSEPRFTHVYEEPGQHAVRVEARNPAGQTASQVVVFNVGDAPPAGLASTSTAVPGVGAGLFWSVALAGIVLVLAIGAVLLVRTRSKAPMATEQQALAYSRVLEQEVAQGAASEELSKRLKPLRAVLGVSDTDHARLEAEARTLHAAARGSGRLLVPGESFLNRYQVLRHLAAGGGGRTYVCRDTRLTRNVVLKVLRAPDQSPDLDVLLREARAFAAVRHDRVALLYDVEQVGDDIFLVMEHVEGGSLADRISNGPLSPPEITRLGDDLLGALSAVHAAGVVHRDVKPPNVLVAAEGRFKLADFGIAHLPGYETTFAGLAGSQAAGTVRYMSPEQARGERVDARTDLYSAALVLYEAWTGGAYLAPRPDESLVDVQLRAARGDGSLEALAGPARLRAFFERALGHDINARFQDAGAMRNAFLDALRGAEGGAARRPGMAHREQRTGQADL